MSQKRHESVTRPRYYDGMKVNVLMVDDDIEFTELIKFNLESKGCQMSIAHDGAEGLRLAREEAPDLILLDLMLPDIAGMTLCEILQSGPSTKAIPIFIVSALNEHWFEKGSKRAKFTRFFTKPINLKTLRESISSICQKGNSIVSPPLKPVPRGRTGAREVSQGSSPHADPQD